jgi:hypothetical protein
MQTVIQSTTLRVVGRWRGITDRVAEALTWMIARASHHGVLPPLALGLPAAHYQGHRWNLALRRADRPRFEVLRLVYRG